MQPITPIDATPEGGVDGVRRTTVVILDRLIESYLKM
jgi:hypothetical protein